MNPGGFVGLNWTVRVIYEVPIDDDHEKNDKNRMHGRDNIL